METRTVQRRRANAVILATACIALALGITDNARGSPETARLLKIGMCGVSLSPASLAFGSQSVDKTSTARTVTLSNMGNAALSITSLALTGTNARDFAQTNTCGKSLAAFSHCTIRVTFTPLASGSLTASVSITDNARGSPQTVSLSGTGKLTASTPTAPEDGLSPTSLAFGNLSVGTSSTPQTATLSNSGNAPLNITSLVLTGTNASDFAQTNTCGSSVAAGANCTISVAFTPSASGSRTASVSITDNASGSPQSVSLTGAGNNPQPTLTSLSPASAVVGAAVQTLTLNGTNFLASSTVTYNGVGHTATFVSSTQLTISLSGTDQATAGSYAVVVTNPAPGGGASSPLNFAVGNPQPSLSSLSPASAVVGAGAQTLTLNGTNFLASSTVTYNGVGHTATFVSSTQLTISLSGTDQATAGSYAVVVTNPAPGGGASSPLNFAVNNPAPTLTSLSPASAAVGAASQTLTLTGTNFLASSTVTYNGVGHTATFVSSTQLTISLSATDQATAGSYAVVVTNPGPGGGASSPLNFAVTVNNPVPSITSLSPPSATAGAGAQTLTINGTGFLSSSTMTYNGVGHGATYVSATQLTITLSAGDQATAGTFAVVVTNPAPGGGASNALNFMLDNPLPTLTSLSPASAVVGAASQTLTLTGTNFLTSSTVTYNAVGHTATYVSATELTITLSTGDQATAGAFAVVVTNPAPGGGASNALNFMLDNPLPTLTSLSPSSATAGAAAQALTINGTGFLSTSTVTYNGVGHAATYVSATQLTVTLSAGDQGTVGAYAVVVTNPAPGGGASNALNFTVNNPVPSITSLSPPSATAGAGAQTLTINGTNFLSTSTVTYNGVGHTATFVSATQLTISLSATDQATAGSYAVVVTNPAPGGGASNALNFTVTPSNPSQPITFVQSTSTSQFSGQTASAAFPGSVTSGDLIIVGVFADVGATVSVTDALGDTFTQVVHQPVASDHDSDVFVGTAGTSGADTITVNAGSGMNVYTFSIHEYIGVTTAVDAFSTAQGNSTAPASGSLTTVTSNDLIFAWFTNGNNFANENFSSLNAAYTKREMSGSGTTQCHGRSNCVETGDLVALTTQTTNATATLNVSDIWSATVIAFKGAASAGTGTGAVASLSPTSLTFASQVVGATSAAQTITLNNTGNLALSISSIALTGTNASDFAQTNNCGASVAAGTNCTISVTFKPTAGGTRTAAVTLTDNATGSPQTVSLTGTGTSAGPAASLSPTSLAFGNQQPIDVTSSAQTVTLSNTGNAALSITSLALTGTNAGDFDQSNTCPSSLAAGDNCTIVVFFTPSIAGTEAASLSITDTASGSPQTVALSGAGIHDVILSWTASTTSGVVGYNVYRGTTSGGPYPTELNSSPINGTAYTDATVQAGQTYYYVVTAVASNDVTQSADSTQVSATVP
jgi:hypothetical protein